MAASASGASADDTANGAAVTDEIRARDIDKRIAAIDRSAGEAWRSLVLLLGVCLVFLATVIETSHQDIFLNTSKPLPQVGTRLPLFGIYTVVPIAITLLHAVAVFQVTSVIRQVRALWRADARDGQIDHPAASLPPSLLVQWVVSCTHGRGLVGVMMPVMLGALLFVIVLLIPLGTLLAAQIRFLPYHLDWVTQVQRTLLMVDVVFVFLSVVSLGFRGIGPTRGEAGVRVALQPGLWWSSAATVFLLVAFVWSGAVATTPHSAAEELSLRLAGPVFGAIPVPDEDERPLPAWQTCDAWRGSWIPPLPTYFKAKEVILGYGGDGRPVDRQMLCIVHLLTENPATSPLFLRRNLVLREARFADAVPPQATIERFGEQEAWRQAAASIAVQGRDLRYADLTGAYLRGVNLRGTNLTGARLEFAQLDYADLGDIRADLVGGCPEGSEQADEWRFEGDDFCRVRLDHARLSAASLENVNFWKARLVGASLEGASLYGANLRFTDLTGANLEKAKLVGGNFSGAFLNGANLRNADLRAASLFDVAMDGATLAGARLDAADVRNARIVLADLQEGAPSFFGSDMLGAKIGVVHAAGLPAPDDTSTSLDEKLAQIALTIELFQLQPLVDAEGGQDSGRRWAVFHGPPLGRQIAEHRAQIACEPDTLPVASAVARLMLADIEFVGLTRANAEYHYTLAQRLLANADRCTGAQSLSPAETATLHRIRLIAESLGGATAVSIEQLKQARGSTVSQ
ncbi:MAG: pentapeptide repeat-containing protein [Pseudomonadota bacterium]